MQGHLVQVQVASSFTLSTTGCTLEELVKAIGKIFGQQIKSGINSNFNSNKSKMSYSIAIDKNFYISRHQIFNEFNHCLHYANGSNNVFGRKRRADVNRFTYCFCYAILSSLCYHRVLGMKLTMWTSETDSLLIIITILAVR